MENTRGNSEVQAFNEPAERFVSLTDNFMSTAKQILLATENIKRLSTRRFLRLSHDVAAIDRTYSSASRLIDRERRQPPHLAS